MAGLVSLLGQALKRNFSLPALLRAAYAAVALTLSFYWLRAAGPELQIRSLHFPSDGFADWAGAKELAAGHNPYADDSLRRIGIAQGFGFGHPPTTLLWFLPFAHLDANTMKYAFTLMTLVMLWVHVVLILQELRLPMWGVTAVLTISSVLNMTWMHVHLSQVDLSEMIALLFVLSWWFLRRGRDAWAGIMAGLACTLKLYPGVLVVFFALTQRWRALVAAVAVYLLFALEVVRRLGFKAYPEFFESTIGHADRWVNSIRNASISGIVQRLFYPAYAYPYGHALSPAGQLLAVLASAALVLLAWFVTWPAMRAGRSNPTAVDIPFAIMTIVALAPGPYQWEHYNVTLLLPCFVLLATALHARRPDGRRNWRTLGVTGVVLAAVWAMLDMNFWTRHDLPVQAQQNPALRNKMYWYEVTGWLPWVALLIALLVLCWRRYPPTLPWSRQPRPAQ